MNRDRRPLYAALVANTVSIAGNSLTLIGIPWFVLETTGSATRAGVVAFCAMVPVIVASLVGGPLIDRIGRRRVSIGTDLLCGAAVGAVPLLHRAGLLEFWTLCVLMAVNGLFHAPGETARSALLPELAERAGTTVTRAASLFDGVSRGARMLGAAVGGVLIAALGAETVLAWDAATFAISAAVVAVGLRGLPAGDPVHRRARRPSYRRELVEGYAFLARSPLLLAVSGLVLVTNALDQGGSAVLLPVHAERELGGPAALGLISALWGVGAVVGAFLYGAYGTRFRRWPVFAVCALLIGLPRYATAAFSSETAPLAVVMVCSGIAGGMINPIISTVTFERVPDALRTRVLGVSRAGSMMATPLGGLAAGLLVDGVGLTAAFLAVGGIYFAVTLAPLLFPVWRGMDAGQRTAVVAEQSAQSAKAGR
ncbi:putative multidrug-efflux transporter [Streptomyces sp. YIM 130001]|uniref:MFS transporter n=1 Tax=Streptomyces sp. YIM 130001 TaxID=2259644 RepID=UPI000E656C0A|nr:MFS transporter [Streptomyces sp. YIM 130001]RII19788.1 putative multidrug-efflux transporter [Streptomyces sp. YIM 130001]